MYKMSRFSVQYFLRKFIEIVAQKRPKSKIAACTWHLRYLYRKLPMYDNTFIVKRKSRIKKNKEKKTKKKKTRGTRWPCIAHLSTDKWPLDEPFFFTSGLLFEPVNLILPMTFLVTWPFGSGKGVQNRLSRWQPWWPSWTFSRNYFS